MSTRGPIKFIYRQGLFSLIGYFFPIQIAACLMISFGLDVIMVVIIFNEVFFMV